MLGPGNGAWRRHDQAAELGLLDLHNPWGPGHDQRTRPTRDHHGRRDQQALTGVANQYPWRH